MGNAVKSDSVDLNVQPVTEHAAALGNKICRNPATNAAQVDPKGYPVPFCHIDWDFGLEAAVLSNESNGAFTTAKPGRTRGILQVDQ
ncbi:MAG: hypothetical protein IIX35_06955 [Paraprevotella sp.]|nr:hypothetical protein [Paraprevotella sp.]